MSFASVIAGKTLLTESSIVENTAFISDSKASKAFFISASASPPPAEGNQSIS